MTIKQIRTLFKIPKDQRIGQYIYNRFRKYEQRLEVNCLDNGNYTEFKQQGIDIFDVSDEEFINNF